VKPVSSAQAVRPVAGQNCVAADERCFVGSIEGKRCATLGFSRVAVAVVGSITCLVVRVAAAA